MKMQQILAIPLLLVLGACSGGVTVDAPSLSKRPYELTDDQQASLAHATIPTDSSDTAESPPAPLPPAYAEEVARWKSMMAAGKAAYQQAMPGAQSAVAAARGAAVGSEAWVMAEVALSRLEAARAPSVEAAAAFDRLYIQATQAQAMGVAAALRPTRDAMAADTLAQSLQIALLGGILRQ